MSLASSLSPNLFIGEVAWKQQLRIEPSLDGSEEVCPFRESAEILLFENENAILAKFVNVEGTLTVEAPISAVFYFVSFVCFVS